MVQTLILPGLNGSSDAHWQRIWASERPDCKVLEQSEWACPSLPDWKRRLETELAASREDVILLAHSLGCILAASLALSPLAARVRAAVLVAPCDIVEVERLHPCCVQLDQVPLETLPFETLIVGSLNDPYMNVPSLYRHGEKWGASIRVIGHAGHINVASGYGRWVEGYRIFDHFLEDARNDRRRAVSVHTRAGRAPEAARYSETLLD
ncbi:alpha/beta hydrolase [Rhizobium paknamense]|uniref:Alpha/beta hydrolase family esterase n=1 Tax=Rhizobium paknamense TaxID=1206817 RepID=A0ABU0IE61_9HYPH|nr:alpha/beta hydrolase [Rhizobium paknamense]MDQ0455735.1 putative alpha/beta hydrolase family esterase [Rhizobium paknamense]